MNYKSSYINYDFPNLIRNSGFTFDDGKVKNRVNWNDIRVIDINKLIDERDFRTVDRHIREVLNCQLNVEFNVEILDSGFVKLFRLAQLTVEYLLECRRHLDLIAMTMKEDINETNDKMANLKTQLNSKEMELKKLQYKNRKKHFTAKDKNYMGLQNVLKNIILPNEQFSAGEQNSAEVLNKCSYCGKIFINAEYLQSHISRRHSDHINKNLQINVSPSQNLTEKLNLEIKELKEKLNLAEKHNIMEQNFIDNHTDASQNIQSEELMQTEAKKVQNDCVTETSLIFQQLTERNEASIEMLEELKEKQANYHNELMQIKSQLLENINELKIKSDNRHDDNENDKVAAISAIIDKHESQLNNIKINLDEKAAHNLTDVKLQIENQEIKLNQKLNSIEIKHSQLIENVQSNIIKHLNEFQIIQQTYQSKIVQLENSALEQRRATEEQTKQIIEITKETNKIISEISSQQSSKNKYFHDKVDKDNVRLTTNPVITVSQETLPPYEEKSKIKSPVPKKVLEDETDSEDNTMDNDILLKHKDVVAGKSIEHKPKKIITKKQRNSKVKTKLKKIKEQKKPKLSKYDDDSESDKMENNVKNSQTDKINNYSNSMLRILEKKPELENDIKSDLNMMLRRRLENLGVNADTKTISLDSFKKSMTILGEKQNLMGKQYKGYRRIKKNIMKRIDNKMDSSTVKKNSPPLNVKHKKPLRLMESIINKVKTLNITKSKENILKEKSHFIRSDAQIVDVKKKLSAKSILAMIDADKSDKAMIIKENSSGGSSDAESESDSNKHGGETIVTTAISHLPTNNIDELLLSPIRKPNTSSPIIVKGFQTSSPVQSDDALLNNGESKLFLERKSYSADNINKRNLHASPKGVLKTISSINSLSKKRVNFDLDANEMKSLSSDNSSDSIAKPIPMDSSNSAINLNISDDTIESERIDEKSNSEFMFTNESIQQIQVSTKQSPKIAEIASAIESKLGSRLNITPPAGSIEAMFQAKSIQEKHDDPKNNLSGRENVNLIPKNIINMDSDMDLSDWSIEELLHAK